MGLFLVFSDGQIQDWDLDALEEMLGVFDSQLDRVYADWKRLKNTPLGDPADFWPRLEYIAGIGFVACQNYLLQVYPPMEKRDALKLGPPHSCGQSVASIVNAAANYWKHQGEWLQDDPADKRRDRTENVLLAVTESRSPNVFEVLEELVAPQAPRFKFLVPLLVQWRSPFV
jgi:hypothetical protein